MFSRVQLVLSCAALLTLGACAEEIADERGANPGQPELGRGGKADAPGSCESGGEAFCGGQSADGCWCDDQCVEFGDCCSDVVDICEAPEPTAGCDQPARYRVTFTANWSGSGLANAHWSPLIGATHSEAVDFWNFGGIASPGIEEMAETGGTGPLVGEIEDAIADGNADQVLSGSTIDTAAGSTSIVFDIDGDNPHVTLTSMMAPSPDWFVGVAGVSLCPEGQWIEGTANLSIFDAGTDNGTTFTAADSNTSPAEPIGFLRGFSQGNAPITIGTMLFERIQ